MRLVVDTNVLLSGLFWRGAPHRLLELVRRGGVTLVTSPALLAELADALAKPKFADVLAVSDTRTQSILDDIQVLAEIVYPEPLSRRVCRDPDDDDVLACALAARANLLISGDADLLSLGAFEGIPIIAPGAAVERLEAKDR